MAKKQKKQYTWQQKVKYHTNRIGSNVSDNKKTYSKFWLDGFYDEHYKNNFSAIKNEIVSRKRDKVPYGTYDLILGATKNGLAERNKSNVSNYTIREMRKKENKGK